jgi:hypothetical protein
MLTGTEIVKVAAFELTGDPQLPSTQRYWYPVKAAVGLVIVRVAVVTPE